VAEHLILITTPLTVPTPLHHTQITIIPANEVAWSLYKDLLQSAQKKIVVVFWYVFQGDSYSNQVCNLLVTKLKQGVAVTIVFPDVDAQGE